MVLSGLVTAWRLAVWPTKISPESVYATADGVVRAPSWFGITTGSSPSMTETTELVVPRSIPMIFAMCDSLQQIRCVGMDVLSRKRLRVAASSMHVVVQREIGRASCRESVGMRVGVAQRGGQRRRRGQ